MAIESVPTTRAVLLLRNMLVFGTRCDFHYYGSHANATGKRLRLAATPPQASA